jgi:hypothetical protein
LLAIGYVILRGQYSQLSCPNGFYEELEGVFYTFLKYHMKISLRDFNAKMGKEDILTRQLGMTVYTKLVIIIKLD